MEQYKLEFREFSLEFAKDVAKIKINPAVLDNGYDKTPSPFTESDAKELFDKYIGKIPAERLLIFFEDDLAGEVGITLNKDVFRLSAEIGYFIAEKFWGKGFATEAIRKMTQHAFEHFEINRIVAGVFEFNKASMKALEKNGYYLESIRKNAVIKNGKIMDDYIYVKLKESLKE